MAYGSLGISYMGWGFDPLPEGDTWIAVFAKSSFFKFLCTIAIVANTLYLGIAADQSVKHPAKKPSVLFFFSLIEFGFWARSFRVHVDRFTSETL